MLCFMSFSYTWKTYAQIRGTNIYKYDKHTKQLCSQKKTGCIHIFFVRNFMLYNVMYIYIYMVAMCFA